MHAVAMHACSSHAHMHIASYLYFLFTIPLGTCIEGYRPVEQGVIISEYECMKFVFVL